MLTSTRRRLAAAALVLLAPTLTACGFNYQTDQVYQPGVGSNDRESRVDVLAAVVVSSLPGEGTLVTSLVNNDTESADKLVGVTGEGLKVQLTAPVEVPADSLVDLADTGAVAVQGETVEPGKWARLTLTFESGQTTEINVSVVPYKDEYADVRLASPPAAES